MTRTIVIEPYRETLCDNSSCPNYGKEIDPDLSWAMNAPPKSIIGLSFRDFCPKCGDGAGWRIKDVIDK